MASLNEKALAKLSIAASVIDFLFVVGIWKLCERIVRTLPWHNALEQWYLAAIAILLILHLFIVEVLLSGHSIGRLCCGLSVGHARPAAATIGWRMKRFILILSKFGLGSLNPGRLAAYNRAKDTVFKSDLAGVLPEKLKQPADIKPGSPSSRPKPSNSGPKLQDPTAPSAYVIAGPNKGISALINLKAGVAETGALKIGRDATWANLVLSKDGKVSAKHCIIYVRNGRYIIIDGDGAGRASTNGTTVNGTRIGINREFDIAEGDLIGLGNSTIEFKF